MSDRKSDGGSLTADVSEDVIRAALESVEKRSSPSKPPAEGEAAGSADTAALEKDLKEARAQLDLSVERGRETMERLKDTHERYLRAAADLDNYKKRAQREKEEAEKYGVTKLLKDMLPVLDNLDRALSHAETTNPLTAGVQATRRIFEDTLGKYGVKGFSAVGETFDPTKHEAMQQVATADAPPGTVVSEMVRGYLLHDRLVRPALVTVATAPAAAASETPPEASPVPSKGDNS